MIPPPIASIHEQGPLLPSGGSQLAQHVVQDTAMTVVFRFLGRIDTNTRLKSGYISIISGHSNRDSF